MYEEVEAPLVAVLARMEAVGIGVDKEYLEELGESFRDQLATLERKIHQAAGERRSTSIPPRSSARSSTTGSGSRP